MSIIIKNMKDLDSKLIERYISHAMDKTEREIYECINKTIRDYYGDYKPTIYDRTYKFLRSLTSTKVEIKNGTIQCIVMLDRNYLDYVYAEEDKLYGEVTGLLVAEWASEGKHGGMIERNEKFWLDDKELYDQFLELFKKNLEVRGFIVK